MAKQHNNWSMAAAMMLAVDPNDSSDNWTCDTLALAIQNTKVTKLSGKTIDKTIRSDLDRKKFSDGIGMFDFEGNQGQPRFTNRARTIRDPDVQNELRWLRERLQANTEEANLSVHRVVSQSRKFSSTPLKGCIGWEDMAKLIIVKIDSVLEEA